MEWKEVNPFMWRGFYKDNIYFMIIEMNGKYGLQVPGALQTPTVPYIEHESLEEAKKKALDYLPKED